MHSFYEGFFHLATVWTETKRQLNIKYSASEELFFAGALEDNLIFPVPSRGGTFFYFFPSL